MIDDVDSRLPTDDDDRLVFYIPFSVILVISGRWKDDKDSVL